MNLTRSAYVIWQVSVALMLAVALFVNFANLYTSIEVSEPVSPLADVGMTAVVVLFYASSFVLWLFALSVIRSRWQTAGTELKVAFVVYLSIGFFLVGFFYYRSHRQKVLLQPNN